MKNQNPEIRQTKDGSPTLFHPGFKSAYHSMNGALSESMHVFIEAGLNHCSLQFGNNLRVLEIGFGTGMNAWLSLEFSIKKKCRVNYTGIEKFPLRDELQRSILNALGNNAAYEKIISAKWNEPVILHDFYLLKQEADVFNFTTDARFHCIYFDAFSPDVQPEMWTDSLFHKMKSLLVSGGCMVTYCAKGNFKRMLKNTGFTVETLTGAPGKREMVRAINSL